MLAMKQIHAYIQPFMLDKVVTVLKTLHVHGMSVVEARGFGREKDQSYPHHYVDDTMQFTPKLKIEIICIDRDVATTVEAIQKNAHTGRKGDGKIFVTDVQEAISILSGERGENAL
jgi:nitrogen regulatory protein P-II 1